MTWPRLLAKTLFVVVFAGIAPCADSQKPDDPTAIASDFYRWYLAALSGDRNPIHQDRAELKKFISATLLTEIDKRSKSADGLDLDYFLQTQDYLDGWITNISAAKVTQDAATAVVIVTLGDKGPDLFKLRVTLKREQTQWRIAAVRHIRG